MTFSYFLVNRIGLLKPHIRSQVEDMIIQSAQTGKMVGKVDDGLLVSLLEKVGEGVAVRTVKVKTTEHNIKTHLFFSTILFAFSPWYS